MQQVKDRTTDCPYGMPSYPSCPHYPDCHVNMTSSHSTQEDSTAHHTFHHNPHHASHVTARLPHHILAHHIASQNITTHHQQQLVKFHLNPHHIYHITHHHHREEHRETNRECVCCHINITSTYSTQDSSTLQQSLTFHLNPHYVISRHITQHHNTSPPPPG